MAHDFTKIVYSMINDGISGLEDGTESATSPLKLKFNIKQRKQRISAATFKVCIGKKRWGPGGDLIRFCLLEASRCGASLSKLLLIRSRVYV